MKLLCLSNGHGEDAIAVRILEHLQRHPEPLALAALPLVGEGHAYAQLNIPLIGPVQQMPSGGFIYMDARQLWQDLQGGLLQLTLTQYQAIRQWVQAGGAIVAVGDIVPLLLAWLSGADYGFVGTAKSEYYLRDERGWLAQTSGLERALGSVYLPWERWLMQRHRCKAVFPRDTLTTEILQQWSIPAFDLGNPMMDGIQGKRKKEKGKRENHSLVVLLLPGSRMPECQRNWQMMIAAVAEIVNTFEAVVFLAAIAPALNRQPFQEHLLNQGWQAQSLDSATTPINDAQSLAFTQNKATLFLSQNAYQDCLLAADLAIAMAGTATEQFVGLGKPVIAIPGQGPQFTYAFAEAQTRLLGPSVILVEKPQQVAQAIQSLLSNPQHWQHIAENGKRRMGGAGAAKRIAECLREKLFNKPLPLEGTALR